MITETIPNDILANASGRAAAQPTLTASDFANSPALRQSIIDELSNTTAKAAEIIDLISQRKVGLNFLGDDLFRRLGYSNANAVYNPLTRQIYLRRSDANFYSTIVHEGTHALDHANGLSTTLFGLELRAHLFQRQFEVFKNGHSARYPTVKAARDRVLRDYRGPRLHTDYMFGQRSIEQGENYDHT